MITLDRLEQKIDALTAGMNSILATLEQGNKWAVERTEAIQKERQAQHEAVLNELRGGLAHIRGLLAKPKRGKRKAR